MRLALKAGILAVALRIVPSFLWSTLARSPSDRPRPAPFHPKPLDLQMHIFTPLGLIFLRRSTNDEVPSSEKGPSAPTVAPRGISLFNGNELKL